MSDGVKTPLGVRSPAFGEGRGGVDQAPNDADHDVDLALAGDLGQGIHPRVLDHVLRPRNAGSLTDPDGEATLTRDCGDGLCIQVRLRGDLVDQVRFMTNGCGAMLACGSAATELIQGKRLQRAMAIDARQVMEALEGLPPGEEHCAVLAAQAVKAAMRDALVSRAESWKRPYRKRGI